MNTTRNPGRFGMKLFLFAAAIATAHLAVAQATKSWSNPDLSWPPQASQEWSIGSNWNGGTLPADLDYIVLTRWTGSEHVGAVTLLDSATNIASTFRSGYGSKLYIDSSRRA